MIRTIIITAAMLLTPPAAHAQDNSGTIPGTGPEPHQWGFRQQQLQGVDMNAALDEYETLTKRNQKSLKNTLRSYTNNTLKSIGMPEQGIALVGSAVGLLTQGVKLNLNESKTLALELKDVNDSERTLYFGVTLDW
jgi:hypothetical protein